MSIIFVNDWIQEIFWALLGKVVDKYHKRLFFENVANFILSRGDPGAVGGDEGKSKLCGKKLAKKSWGDSAKPLNSSLNAAF